MTLSLRKLPPDVEQAITETSRREGISRNKATIRLLEKALHKSKKNNYFDEFLGSWSKQEADDFDTQLAEMRKVDPADWQSR